MFDQRLEKKREILGKTKQSSEFSVSCRRIALGSKIAHYSLVDNIKILHVFLVGKKVYKKSTD